MSPPIKLFFVCFLTFIVADEITFVNRRHLLQGIPPQADPKQDKPIDIKKDNDENAINLNKPKEVKKINTPSKTKNETKIEEHVNTTKVEQPKVFKTNEMESGALLRGVTVVVIITVLVLIYMGLRTYCGKRIKQPMVSKYGVRARRSDLEMAPLQLDEEDDETLFEVNAPPR